MLSFFAWGFTYKKQVNLKSWRMVGACSILEATQLIKQGRTIAWEALKSYEFYLRFELRVACTMIHVAHWSKSPFVLSKSVQGFSHQKWPNFMIFLRIRKLTKWTLFSVMIHKLQNAKINFIYMLRLISSTRKYI